MKKRTLILSSLAALLLAASSARARDRHEHGRFEQRQRVVAVQPAYRAPQRIVYAERYARPQRVVLVERSSPRCAAPVVKRCEAPVASRYQAPLTLRVSAPLLRVNGLHLSILASL